MGCEEEKVGLNLISTGFADSSAGLAKDPERLLCLSLRWLLMLCSLVFFHAITAQQNPGRIILSEELEMKLDKIIELEEQLIAANFSMVGFEGKQSLSEIREKREEGTLTEEEAEAYMATILEIVKRELNAIAELLKPKLDPNLSFEEGLIKHWEGGDEETIATSFEELLFDASTFAEGNGEEMITVVTPAGKPIQIPENSKRYYLTLDEEVTPGALIAFTHDGKWYKGVKYGGEFRGYREGDDLLWGESQEWDINSLVGSNLLVRYGFCSESSETERTGYFTKPDELNLTGSGPFSTIEILDSEDDVITFPDCDCERLYAKYKDSPLMQSSILANLIEQDHCVLQGMTTTGEGLGSETEFMLGLNTMIDGFALMFTATAGSAVLLPIIAENLSVNVTKEVLKTQVVNKSKDFAIGFAVDGFIQMLIIKLSDNERDSPDYYQMTASGVENTFNRAYLSVVISCGFDAMYEHGQLKRWEVIEEWDETGWACALGALSALAGEGGSRLIGAGAGALMRSIKNNPQKFADLLKSLGLNDGSVDRLVKEFGGNAGWFDNLPVGLKEDIKSTSALRELFEKSDNEARGALVYSWRLLSDAGRTGGSNPANGLTRNVDAIKALHDARLNSNVSDLGISVDDLVKIQGYGTDAATASFKDILTDINKMADNLTSNNIEVENLNQLIEKFRRSDGFANNTNKGFHYVIKDLGNDLTTFNGKKVTLEFSIPNSRGTNSSIDAFCANCDVPNLKIEYKSGPGSISSITIKEQFIERDLFNANSLDEIQWRTEGTDFNSDKLKTWLKENKASVQNIIDGVDGVKSKNLKAFFDFDELDDVITDTHIDDFVESNYSLIFK